MRSSLSANLLFLFLTCSEQVAGSLGDGSQQVLIAPQEGATESGNVAAAASAQFHHEHAVDDEILAALKAYPDPVDALISLQPEMAAQLDESRLIHVFGEDNPRWMKEGDKLRLRQDGKKFMDITDHQELYADTDGAGAWSGKASTHFQSQKTSWLLKRVVSSDMVIIQTSPN